MNLNSMMTDPELNQWDLLSITTINENQYHMPHIEENINKFNKSTMLLSSS